MKPTTACLLLALAPAVAVTGGARAEDLRVDANLVTGIDISDSVSAGEVRLQLEGLAAAMRSPQVLHAIQNGWRGRVGFAVFAWHHGDFPEIVGWRIIASAADAEAAAREIEARLAVDINVESRAAAGRYYIGRLTDVSQAIDHAGALLQDAPFATDRSVINIIGEGADNVGEAPAPARDRLVAAGGTVNGLVPGGAPDSADYYRREVSGGPGAFVIAATDGAPIARMMERKLLQDLIALANARSD